jgi:integrase
MKYYFWNLKNFSTFRIRGWSLGRDLIPRPTAYKALRMKRQPFGCQSIIEDFRDFLTVDLRLEPRTVQIHCNNIKRFFGVVRKNPTSISKLEVRGYLHQRMKKKSRATTNNDLKSLKRFFRDFLNCPEVVKSFRFPQSPFKAKVVLSKNELRLAYEVIESEIGRALFLFYASTGLRRSEVLGLSVDEVDFKKRMVVPNCHNGSSKHSYVSFYNAETEEALRLIDLDTNKLFNISDRQFRKIWKITSEKIGFTVGPQKLREWFCCEMGRLGVSDRYIDAFCGRTPKSVLARHYTDYNPERLKRIYDEANLKILD